MQIQKVQKHTDPAYLGPDPEHCYYLCLVIAKNIHLNFKHAYT
jgi:hypothetical protein